MKKLTVMLLIAAMVLGVSACGNSANKGNTATESQMSTQEAEDLDAIAGSVLLCRSFVSDVCG